MNLKTLIAALVIFSTGFNANAASVNAVSVESLTNESGAFKGTYTFKRSFASNDPTYPNRIDYVKKSITVPKRGNPINWVKKSPIEIGVLAAVASAGWAIDELTSQVTRTTVAPPTEYVEGRYWKMDGSSYYGRTAEEAYNAFLAVTSVQYRNVRCAYQCGSTQAQQWKWERWNATYNYWQDTWMTTVQSYSCTANYNAVCEVEPQQSEITENVPEEDLWQLIDPLVDQATLKYWASDELDLPRYYPEVAAEQNLLQDDVTGAPEVISTTDDPLDAPAGEAQPVEVAEYTNDLLQQIKESLQVDVSVPESPEVDFTIPELTETDWALESEHTGFWNFLRTTFPFSLATAPLAAIAAPTPNAPEFCYTAVGLTDCASMSMWDGLFSAIRFAEGLLMIFGFYLVMQRAIMRFAS